MDSTAALSPTETTTAQLRTILRGVLMVLGMWRLEFPQMRLVHRRFSATFQRIERLLERFRAGRLWQRPQLVVAPGRRVSREPEARLPRRFGWLVLAGGHQAACFGTQLQAVLTSPDMAELLAASAQAGRILRPLCRALAVELPGMTASAPTKTPALGERRRRRTRPRTKPEPFRVPMPRGVVAAARREGFGKDR